MKLAQQFRVRRENANLARAEVAKAAGVGNGTVERLEKGEEIGLKKFVALASVIGYEVVLLKRIGEQ